MKKAFGKLLGIVSVLALDASIGMTTAYADEHNQSNNNPGAIKAPHKTPDFPSCWYKYTDFGYAGDIRFFSVERTEDTAAGILRVRTLDCCIPGDKWKAEIVSEIPRFRTDDGVSDGNTSEFNGPAAVAPFKQGTVTISYVEGVDIFPAGMTIEFCYSRERKDGLDELRITEIQ